MCERGMGSAVGQEPSVNERITSWAKEFSDIPVLVKLTPNVGDILPHGLAAKAGGADGVSLINTIKSLIGVDIDNFVPQPVVGNKSSNGGYCGAAVRPIALHMVASLAREPSFGLPISGIGGITNWRDAVEFLLLGSASVQVCTEVMLRGYGIVEDMNDGLEEYMRQKGFETLDDLIGKAIPAFSEWGNLDLNYETIAIIDSDACIGCQLCMVACHDGAHQCIHPDPDSSVRVPVIDEDECVGCNLCEIVCPVPGCISMVEVDNDYAPATWNEHLAGAPLRPKKGAH
jgi:dihydropyrimidine dehydrogenase (NAD+) subunit PreA